MINAEFKHPLLKFEQEVARIIAACISLRKELDEHKRQIAELANSFSSKLENNSLLPSFINRYSEIAKIYDTAYKDFSLAYPDICKDNSHISNLINELNQSFDEISSGFNFKTDFEDAEPILKSLELALSRVIGIGSSVRGKIQEIFAPAIKERNLAIQIRKMILVMSTGICLLILGYAITRREAVLQVAIICAFWMLFLIWVKRDEKRLKQNGLE